MIYINNYFIYFAEIFSRAVGFFKVNLHFNKFIYNFAYTHIEAAVTTEGKRYKVNFHYILESTYFRTLFMTTL